MSTVQHLMQGVEPHRHVVQLYRPDEPHLTTNVAQYVYSGLERGGAALIVATPEHSDAFVRTLEELGAGSRAAIGDGRLKLLDARETLASMLLDGEPDWERFETVIGSAIDGFRFFEHTGLRAYGEMVGLLWTEGRFAAAARLEEYWNRLLTSAGFELYCAYPIDVLGPGFHPDAVDPILCSHTHVLAAAENSDLDIALDRALDEVLGAAGATVRISMNGPRAPSWASIPRAEAGILWLKQNLPEHAEMVVTRARQYYQNERRFRALVENSSDAISLVDADGKVLYASASTARVLGFRAHDLLGRSSFDLVHPDDADETGRVVAEVLKRPRWPVQLKARLRRADGSWAWVEGTATNLLDDPDIGAIVLNYRDISERVITEEKLRRHSEALARSNAELQSFAYAASHDLKEPLRAVCSYTQLLLQRTQVDEQSRQFGEFIVDGVKRMSALLDDLLSFASIAVRERRRVELRVAVAQALQNLESAIRETGARVTVGPLPAVLGTQTQFVELFQNLISNAMKYRSDRPPQIHVSADRLGSDWVVRVRDNGIGIEPEYHDVVFGLFKRLHNRDVPGTGVGLAICRKIVEGMNGAIWVESQPGLGSTFCFSIPAEIDEAHPAAS